MIRRAYGAKAGYATLTAEAYEAWEELWLDLGVSHHEPPATCASARRWAAAPAILSIGGPSEGFVLPPLAGTGLKFRCGGRIRR